MKVTFKELLESLGIYRHLSAYETNPWMHYDDDQAITCSAEVRIGPGGMDLEAEIQFLYDNPEEHDKTNPDQIMLMRAHPSKDGIWAPHYLKVRGEDYNNKFSGWEKKGCEFFLACIQAMQMGELPDIEELMKKYLEDDDSGRRGRGKIGRKSPKANPAALLGMKKGM